MNEGCAPCVVRPVAEAPTVAPEPWSCPGPLPAGGGGTGHRRRGPRRARRTLHLARADDATAGPDRRRRVGAHRRIMPGSHHRSGPDRRHGRCPRAQGGGRGPEGVLRRSGHRKTGGSGCGLIAGSGIGQTSWVCREGGLASRGLPGLAGEESDGYRAVWSQSHLGSANPGRAANAGPPTVLGPCRKRSAGRAGAGPLPAPCHERFRPRAVNLAGVRCIGREARRRNGA